MIKPNTWVDEDRPEIAGVITDNIVSSMTYEQMRQFVWDQTYDELIHLEWSDIWMTAEQYAPELLEEFQGG